MTSTPKIDTTAPERLDTDELRRLLDSATPGPWTVFTPDDYHGPLRLPGLGIEAPNGDAVVWYADAPETGIKHDPDAALIALAPQLAIALLAERDLAAAREAAAWLAGRDAVVGEARQIVAFREARGDERGYDNIITGAQDVIDAAKHLTPPADTQAALDRLIAEARREAFEEAAGMMRSIFYPEDRSGYETDLDRAAVYAEIQASAVKSYPGAGGDLVTALSMMARQQGSVIRAAKERYDDIAAQMTARGSKEGQS